MVKVKKLKITGSGFKAIDSSYRSDVNAALAAFDWKETNLSESELDVVWNRVNQSVGWDQGYVDSFVNKDESPPQADAQKGDKAMHEWMKHADAYLRALIMLEGRGQSTTDVCSQCRSLGHKAQYRCLSCDNLGLVCETCVVSTHQRLPLHRIEFWNGAYFVKSSLKSLGLRIQLGHPIGERCLRPNTAWGDDFIIIDCDQIHTVGLDYCGCGQSSEGQVEQLLKRRLYPATVVNPKTAATFRVLETFELLQYESKLSAYEYYQTLARLTDNTGLHAPKDRYPTFLRIVHQWRHLKLLKRTGRGHDPVRGVSETRPGECALLCPPCPHPGINLPEGWEKVDQSLKFLYALNIALDACFRMKRKDCSSEAADPGLSKGFAYVVEESAFQEYLKKHEKETEPKSTCSRHDAVNLADMRPGQGYTSSGIATVECSRHNAKRPLAICDMQRGERYCNMDYIIILSLQLCLLKLFFISYDIACQWFIHLLLRLSQIDLSSPLLQPDVEIRFLVPKFHLPAHIPACRNRFAFMLTPGAALGDGEAPERGWGELNPLATSTREMGPGTRRDTLDYHFGDYNWRKIIRLGDSLLKKLITATSDVAEHVIAHQELEATISPDKLRSWTKAMVAWELDSTNPNPYEVTVKTPTQAAVRRQLAEAEEKALATGVDISLSDEVSPCSLIAMGIDLEGEQRSLKTLTKSLWDHSQDRQITRVKLRSNALTRKLEEWFSRLQLYIPASISLRKRELQRKESPKPFEVALWLPSQIGKSVPFDRSLADIEYKLRNAQAHEALGVLRRNLQIRATLYDIKDRWLRGQGANTRALNALATVQARIVAARDEYRQAQAALLALADLLGYANVDQEFLPLEDKDIRSMVEAEPGQGET
ncbi:hypothetical protein EST38_g13758 [Candolleomyces aberdarensis]|uniref:CxC2-like cysteine cluster KDZ transposase-associated domain-containing protein n=1 Tax=Candolleomyces aberdarensis TaxID=2316362 RepID=A0A4Q2CZ61_9AGAR|nr:hypothetical protein EST38_g13758 [Candolleomyces aberdarensis]